MKIGEKFIDNGDSTFTIKKTFANDPYIKRVEMLREAPQSPLSDSYCVGSVPLHLLADWAKEAGVTWDDHEAMRDIVRRKLLSGEFDKLRVWEGKY